MKRSTRMLLMNSGKNNQNRESGQHERGQYPDRRSHEERWDGEGRYTPGREYGGMSYPMGRTGFSLSGEIGRAPEEMERKHRSMGQKASGAEYYQTAPQSGEHTGRESEYAPLTRTMAVEWTRDMDNSDGTHGPHWNMEQVQQVMEQRDIDCDPVKFFAVLDAVYSDYNHRTNVDIDNRIVCYDIKELGKQLKQLGMLVIQDQVWNRVTVNRAAGRTTRYYVDEFHLLLKGALAAWSVEIWKRFRKWGGIPTGITQNSKDLLASPEISNILENSDFIYMLNQAAGDRKILAKQLNISPHQLSYVTHS